MPASMAYRGRFSHFDGQASWALFGPAGPVDAPTEQVLDGYAACTEAGITVLQAESVDDIGLTVVDPTGG